MEEHGNNHMVVAYYSIQLDSFVHAYPSCFKAIAAVARLVETLADLTLGNDVYLQTSHAVQSHLNSELMSTFLCK